MLKDPELEMPEEQEAPAQALAVGMRVRVKAMGITGELMALQGDDAEVAISGKRLRVPRAELVALRSGSPGRRDPGSGRSPLGSKKPDEAVGVSVFSPRSRPSRARTASSPGGGV